MPLTRTSTYSEYHRRQDWVIEAAPPYPAQRFGGRGIVTCAGGPRLFTSAWVLLRALRSIARCELPVEVWHFGPDELDPGMIKLLETQGAHAVDACRVPGAAAIGKNGWALKPFAMIHSKFQEVVFLDADNMPVQDPTTLFDTPQYAATGALFWPDTDPIPPESPLWEICRVEYRQEPSFETGQMVIDKARCWKALPLTMHLNESDFYYRFFYGDKDTFHMAWRMLGLPYSMAPSVRVFPPAINPHWPEWYNPVLGQRDFSGNLIFQHRNQPKWILFGFNPHYPNFRYEEECRGFLKELATLWDGRVTTSDLLPPEPPPRPEGRPQAGPGKWFRYLQLSAGERLIELLPNGRVGAGGTRYEMSWRVVRSEGFPELRFYCYDHPTCRMTRHADGIWRGRWLYHERMPVELIPCKVAAKDRPSIWRDPAAWLAWRLLAR